MRNRPLPQRITVDAKKSVQKNVQLPLIGIKQSLKDLNKLSLKINNDLEEFIWENVCFIKHHDCYSDNCENCQGHNNIEVFLSALKNVDAVTYASWASRNIRSYKDEVIYSGADVPGILRELDNRFFKIHMCNIYHYSELKR